MLLGRRQQALNSTKEHRTHQINTGTLASVRSLVAAARPSSFLLGHHLPQLGVSSSACRASSSVVKAFQFVGAGSHAIRSLSTPGSLRRSLLQGQSLLTKSFLGSGPAVYAEPFRSLAGVSSMAAQASLHDAAPAGEDAVDITRANFRAMLPAIKQALKGCDFFAFDCEMTGLFLDGNRDEYLDDPQDRYTKMRDSASQYVVTQLGISCFSRSADGKRYSAKTFNAYTFPEPLPSDVVGNNAAPRRFTCDAGALSFLAGQNFDFNKWISEGVPYMPLREHEQRMSRVREGYDHGRSRERGKGQAQQPPQPQPQPSAAAPTGPGPVASVLVAGNAAAGAGAATDEAGGAAASRQASSQMNQWQSEPRADVVIEQEADIAYIQGTLDTVREWLAGSEPSLTLPKANRFQRLLCWQELAKPSNFQPLAPTATTAALAGDGTGSGSGGSTDADAAPAAAPAAAVVGASSGANGDAAAAAAPPGAPTGVGNGAARRPSRYSPPYVGFYIKKVEIDDWTHLMLVRATPEEVAEFEAEQAAARMRILEEAAGFSEVLRAMRDCGKPAVGHNCMFDIAYVISNFATGPRDLPVRWEDYKSLVGQWFKGGLYDTKHLARKLPEGVLVDTMLGEVFRAFTQDGPSKEAAQALLAELSTHLGSPVELPACEHAPGFEKYKDVAAGGAAHEAGYDAFMTGVAFANLMPLVHATELKSSGHMAAAANGGAGAVASAASDADTAKAVTAGAGASPMEIDASKASASGAGAAESAGAGAGLEAAVAPTGSGLESGGWDDVVQYDPMSFVQRFMGRINLSRSDMPYMALWGSDPELARSNVVYLTIGAPAAGAGAPGSTGAEAAANGNGGGGAGGGVRVMDVVRRLQAAGVAGRPRITVLPPSGQLSLGGYLVEVESAEEAEGVAAKLASLDAQDAAKRAAQQAALQESGMGVLGGRAPREWLVVPYAEYAQRKRALLSSSSFRSFTSRRDGGGGGPRGPRGAVGANGQAGAGGGAGGEAGGVGAPVAAMPSPPPTRPGKRMRTENAAAVGREAGGSPLGASLREKCCIM